MAWYYQRLERLRYIIAYLVLRKITPRNNNFADVVQQAAAAQGLRPATAKEYTETLIKAFNHDRWKAYLNNNKYIEKEEAQAWINANIK